MNYDYLYYDVVTYQGLSAWCTKELSAEMKELFNIDAKEQMMKQLVKYVEVLKEKHKSKYCSCYKKHGPLYNGETNCNINIEENYV